MALTAEDFAKLDKMITASITKAVSGLATKAELKQSVSGLATKDELKQAVSGLVTKADLTRTENRLITAINLLQRDSYSRLDDHEARITRLEQARPH